MANVRLQAGRRSIPILGLVGPAGAGKTTLATAIAQRTGGTRLSFADPLRQMLTAIGVPREVFQGDRKNLPIPWLCNRTPRQLMRSLGTEWGQRYVGRSVWADVTLEHTKHCRGPIVIDDVRFDHEAKAIIEAGGILAYVHRPGIRYTYAHASECGLTDYHDHIRFVACVRSGEVYSGPAAKALLPVTPRWMRHLLANVGIWPFPPSQALPGPLANPNSLARAVCRQWGMTMVD